jgi:hypothetical protein
MLWKSSNAFWIRPCLTTLGKLLSFDHYFTATVQLEPLDRLQIDQWASDNSKRLSDISAQIQESTDRHSSTLAISSQRVERGVNHVAAQIDHLERNSHEREQRFVEQVVQLRTYIGE